MKRFCIRTCKNLLVNKSVLINRAGYTIPKNLKIFSANDASVRYFSRSHSTLEEKKDDEEQSLFKRMSEKDVKKEPKKRNLVTNKTVTENLMEFDDGTKEKTQTWFKFAKGKKEYKEIEGKRVITTKVEKEGDVTQEQTRVVTEETKRKESIARRIIQRAQEKTRKEEIHLIQKQPLKDVPEEGVTPKTLQFRQKIQPETPRLFRREAPTGEITIGKETSTTKYFQRKGIDIEDGKPLEVFEQKKVKEVVTKTNEKRPSFMLGVKPKVERRVERVGRGAPVQPQKRLVEPPAPGQKPQYKTRFKEFMEMTGDQKRREEKVTKILSKRTERADTFLSRPQKKEVEYDETEEVPFHEHELDEYDETQDYEERKAMKKPRSYYKEQKKRQAAKLQIKKKDLIQRPTAGIREKMRRGGGFDIEDYSSAEPDSMRLSYEAQEEYDMDQLDEDYEGGEVASDEAAQYKKRRTLVETEFLTEEQLLEDVNKYHEEEMKELYAKEEEFKDMQKKIFKEYNEPVFQSMELDKIIEKYGLDNLYKNREAFKKVFGFDEETLLGLELTEHIAFINNMSQKELFSMVQNWSKGISSLAETLFGIKLKAEEAKKMDKLSKEIDDEFNLHVDIRKNALALFNRRFDEVQYDHPAPLPKDQRNLFLQKSSASITSLESIIQTIELLKNDLAATDFTQQTSEEGVEEDEEDFMEELDQLEMEEAETSNQLEDAEFGTPFADRYVAGFEKYKKALVQAFDDIKYLFTETLTKVKEIHEDIVKKESMTYGDLFSFIARFIQVPTVDMEYIAHKFEYVYNHFGKQEYAIGLKDDRTPGYIVQTTEGIYHLNDTGLMRSKMKEATERIEQSWYDVPYQRLVVPYLPPSLNKFDVTEFTQLIRREQEEAQKWLQEKIAKDEISSEMAEAIREAVPGLFTRQSHVPNKPLKFLEHPHDAMKQLKVLEMDFEQPNDVAPFEKFFALKLKELQEKGQLTEEILDAYRQYIPIKELHEQAVFDVELMIEQQHLNVTGSEKEKMIISRLNEYISKRGSAVEQFTKKLNEKRIQEIRNFEAQKTVEFVKQLTPVQYYRLIRDRDKPRDVLAKEEAERRLSVQPDPMDYRLYTLMEERLNSIRLEKYLPGAYITDDIADEVEQHYMQKVKMRQKEMKLKEQQGEVPVEEWFEIVDESGLKDEVPFPENENGLDAKFTAVDVVQARNETMLDRLVEEENTFHSEEESFFDSLHEINPGDEVQELIRASEVTTMMHYLDELDKEDQAKEKLIDPSGKTLPKEYYDEFIKEETEDLDALRAHVMLKEEEAMEEKEREILEANLEDYEKDQNMLEELTKEDDVRLETHELVRLARVIYRTKQIDDELGPRFKRPHIPDVTSKYSAGKFGIYRVVVPYERNFANYLDQLKEGTPARSFMEDAVRTLARNTSMSLGQKKWMARRLLQVYKQLPDDWDYPKKYINWGRPTHFHPNRVDNSYRYNPDPTKDYYVDKSKIVNYTRAELEMMGEEFM